MHTFTLTYIATIVEIGNDAIGAVDIVVVAVAVSIDIPRIGIAVVRIPIAGDSDRTL